MNKKTPIYRGTFEELEKESAFAKEWMIGQCRKVVSTLKDDLRHEIEKALTRGEGGSSRRILSQNVSFGRTRDMRRSYEWRVGQSIRDMDWPRPQRFVLRKDGTVNPENLREALRRWAFMEIKSRESTDAQKFNQQTYKELGRPGAGVKGIDINLGSERGMATVRLNLRGVILGPHKCLIGEIAVIADNMEQVARQYYALTEGEDRKPPSEHGRR